MSGLGGGSQGKQWSSIILSTHGGILDANGVSDEHKHKVQTASK